MSTSTFAQTSGQPAIEWLVFDLGGVLVDVAPGEEICAELSRRTATDPAVIAGLLRERFIETPFSPAERFQLGELDIAGLADALNTSLQQPLSPAALEQSLLEVLRGEKTDAVALLASLAGEQRIACYSNTNAVHWAFMRQYYKLFDHIERRFASQEIGHAKPGRRGYNHVAEALDCAPERCLLIDDRQINVEGAVDAGWQALRFMDADRLAKDLAALGIDPRRAG